MTAPLLRPELLEDERRWAFVFGGLSTAVALLVSVYDIDNDATLPVFILGMAVVACYLLRSVGQRFPAWVVPITAIGGQIGAALVNENSEGYSLLVILALFYAFFREPNRTLAIVALLIALPVPGLLFALGPIDSDGWLYWTIGMTFCAWFGHLAYNLRVVTQQLEEQRTQATDRAIAHERRLIARDVHDLVGHSLSVMMLHLGAARRAVAGGHDTAASSLSQAENVGRDAMAEIRRTVSLLTDVDQQATNVDPLPGLDDIKALATQYRDAGLTITHTEKGDVTAIDRAASLAGYRIVQEALVNATKHAVGSAVTISVQPYGDSDQHKPGAWAVTVKNGPGQRSRPNPAGPSGQRNSEPKGTANGASSRLGSGLGLIGMTERARSVGGSLTASPTSNGGWRVGAILPGNSLSLKSEGLHDDH